MKIRLSDRLVRGMSLGLDTSPVIYFIEGNPRYYSLVSEIFGWIDRGEIVGVTSFVTLCETLVAPIQERNDDLLVEYYFKRTHHPFLRILPIEQTVSEKAAELRAHYRLRTPDAFQIAASLVSGCDAFLTNDLRLKQVTEIPILILDELEL